MSLRLSPTTAAAGPCIQVRSESDIHTLSELEASFTSNRKRPRAESPPVDGDGVKDIRRDIIKDGDSVKDIREDIIKLLQTWKTEQNSTLASWKADQEKILKKLVHDITEVKEKCINIEKCNMEFERSLDFINKQHEDLQKKIQVLEKDRKENRDFIISLETKINEFQRMSRSAAIEIRNIAQNDNETTSDLTTLVSTVGNTLNIKLQPDDIRDIYRGPAKPGATRNIIVEFTKVQTKYDLLTSVRNFNKSRSPADKLNTHQIGLPGDKKPFYVDDLLPASTKKLFFETRAFAKEYGYRFSWTSNSRIFLRKDQSSKAILINSVHCLHELKHAQ